jgi:hypothetical protein
MVNRNQQNTAPETDKSRTQNAAVASHKLSSGRLQSKENFFNDDLIVSLADAYENRRARQVTEWEMRQRVAKVF